MRTYTLTVVLAGALGATACGQQPPPYKPVADVKGLMQGIVDPASDVVWESVATIFTKDGVEELQRDTGKETRETGKGTRETKTTGETGHEKRET